MWPRATGKAVVSRWVGYLELAGWKGHFSGMFARLHLRVQDLRMRFSQAFLSNKAKNKTGSCDTLEQKP